MAQSLQDTAGYAAARGNGTLTSKAPTGQTYVPPPLPVLSQAPVVVSADPGLLTEVKELRVAVVEMKERLRLMSDKQAEGLRIERNREEFGTSVYMVPAP